MHVVFVYVHVKPEFTEEFIKATLENARNSIQEPGIIRFDLFKQIEDPNRFALVEIYHHESDQLKHRLTNHYLVWRDRVTEMMAENRTGVKYVNLFPEDENWR